jgi:endonuclease/exonuclease/phosphatase (EEP) superfamily protein YafD
MNAKDDEQPAKLYPNPGSLMWGFVVAMAVIPVGLFYFSLLGRYSVLAELVCNFRCQIMFMLIPFAILLMGGRRNWFSFFVFGTLVWSMIGIVWVYLPAGNPPPGPRPIRVMSHNVLGHNQNFVAVVQQIQEVDPDVFVAIEFSRNWTQAMDLLNEEYPYQIREARWHGFGIGLFSKYPIDEQRVYQLSRKMTDNPFILATINFGDQKIRIAGLHTISPVNRFRMDLRNDQFRQAAKILAKEDVPTMVMGDFNCAPWSPFLTDFARTTNYRDSRQGFGYHASWPNEKYWPAQIPIDHAFVSNEIHVHSRLIGRQCGSDHRPIVLEISTAK